MRLTGVLDDDEIVTLALEREGDVDPDSKAFDDDEFKVRQAAIETIGTYDDEASALQQALTGLEPGTMREYLARVACGEGARVMADEKFSFRWGIPWLDE